MATSLLPDVGLVGLDEVDLGADRELRSSALAARYGDDFPLREKEEGEVVDDEWREWVRGRWTAHGPGVRRRLFLVERNRLFRLGIQWISSPDQRTWRAPNRSREEARIVHNVVAPALQMRHQVVNENRPGFKTRPRLREPDHVKRAEAQQIALEYQYDQQNLAAVRSVLSYWAQTDGVAFAETYWDPDAGPWHEAGSAELPPGDLRTRVLRIEHVRVSSNATSIEPPDYVVIRKTIPLQTAVAQYGEAVAEKQRDARGADDEPMISISAYRRMGYEIPGEDELYEEMETVEEFVLYAAPSEYLPDGLTVKVVGDAVVFVGPLLFGVIPVTRYTDGSSDPAYFPRAIMEDWIEDQVVLNAILSRWIEHVRRSGGVLLTKAGTIAKETAVMGGMTVVEVRGGAQIGDVLKPVSPIALANEAKELWALKLKAFEDKSGYNDTSRGTFSAEQSGRSILAQRETLERIFAPPVNAAAQWAREWAKVSLHGMRFGYDSERLVTVPGGSRPDLGRALTQDDFDGIADVDVDAETLMPMPRALKLFHLDQLYEKGVLPAEEYRQRYPFAWVQDIDTPDADHKARAMRVVEALKSGQPVPPIRWQDNVAIHQNVLEKEIILRDDLPEPLVLAAHMRWVQLWQLAQAQMMAAQMLAPPSPMGAPFGGAGPTQGPPPNAGPAGGPTPSGLIPEAQPMQSLAPSVAAAPSIQEFATQSDEELAARRFEAIQPY